MSLRKLQQVIDGMDPPAALAALTAVVQKILANLGEEARLQVVVNLVGDAGADKVGSLVHL
jgi:hypothetical protein